MARKTTTDISLKIIFAEALIFSVAAIGLTYIWHPTDPFLINQPFSCYLLLLAIFTLFYGLVAGLIVLFCFLVSLYYFYVPFPYNYGLWLILFTLIFDGFHFYWQRKIIRLKQENNYLKDRTEHTRKNFYMLKISHNILEKSYILKPVSIRSALQEIRKAIVLGAKDRYELFVKFLANTCNIESAAIYLKNGKEYTEVANIGKKTELVMTDPLIRMTEEFNELYYSVSVLPEDMEKSRYLAVIPATNSKNEITGLLLISEIPFLSMNKDNMLIARLFFSYIIDEIGMAEELKPLLEKSSYFNTEFLRELVEVSNIFKRFRIESTIVEIDLSDTDIPKQIGDFLDRISRSTNVTCIDIEENQRVIVLLPITETLGALSFKDRVISEVEDTFGKTYARQIKCRIIPVAKDPLVTIEKIRGQKIE